MKRYEQAAARFRRDKFLRLMTAGVAGVMLAHLLSMGASTVFVGLYPATILLSMNRFSLRGLLVRVLVLWVGMAAGTLAVELFQSIPLLAVIVTGGVFLGILKLFAIRFEMANAYSFMFSYSLSTINASYPDSGMEVALLEPYLIEFLLIVAIVWGCFALFPAQLPRYVKSRPAAAEYRVGTGELLIYAAVWLGIWLVFMLVEWRFALFAFLSFGGAFRYFDRSMIQKIARENIIAHGLCCLVVALFSLLVLGVVESVPVLFFGVPVLLAPFLYLAVFSTRPERAYRYNTMIPGIFVPLTLYVFPDRAAVYQSLLRAELIIFLMAILWLVVEYLYHGATIIDRCSRFRRGKKSATEGDAPCTNRIGSHV